MGTRAESEPQPQPDIIIVERNAMAAMPRKSRCLRWMGNGKSFFFSGATGWISASTTSGFSFLLSNQA